MRYTVVACEIFYRELCLAVAKSASVVDMVFLPKGMHNTPDVMRKALQEKIDAVDPQKSEAVLLGFGLCGNVAKGIRAAQLPLVIPKAHDCITIFLGSRARYGVEFAAHPGTYYYSTASYERSDSGEGSGALGVTGSSEQRFAEYTEKYGEENARYLMEVEASWSEHYTRAAYIRVPEFDFLGYAEKTAAKAQSLGLQFTPVNADLNLLVDLLAGRWDNERFLLVPPGHIIMPTTDEAVLQARPVVDKAG